MEPPRPEGKPAKDRDLRICIRGSASSGGRTEPESSSLAVTRRWYSFSLASLRSTNTLPSRLTPANRPLVFEYENTAATPFVLAAPAASAFLPTGPAAIETFPPRVRVPAWENVLTAAASFRIKTKSVSSNPICPPNPAPAVAIADGADHELPDNRATTMPDPKRPEPRNPAFKTVKTARPWRRQVRHTEPLQVPHLSLTFAPARTSGGITLSGPKACFGSINEVRILAAFLHSPNDNH